MKELSTAVVLNSSGSLGPSRSGCCPLALRWSHSLGECVVAF